MRQVRALEANIADGGPAQVHIFQRGAIQLRLLNTDATQIQDDFPIMLHGGYIYFRSVPLQ